MDLPECYIWLGDSRVEAMHEDSASSLESLDALDAMLIQANREIQEIESKIQNLQLKSQRMMALQQAKVKAVLSGDTVVLCSVSNPNHERTLSLAYVSAPRMRRDGDEPFAYVSREYLRDALIGKAVQFTTLYTIPSTKREYGKIFFKQGSLPDDTVRKGLVKIRSDAGRKDDSEEAKEYLEKLKDIESEAKSASRGVWASGGGNLQTAYEVADPKAFVEKYKGKPLNAVVERVLAGDRMLIRLILSPTNHVQTLVLVAGIKAPSTSRTNQTDGKVTPAEPYGSEAHQFVESRMLHRAVLVDVLGLSPQNVLVCAVSHPNGSIAKFTLEAGLARCIDHHSTLLGSHMTDLRNAEKKAKNGRLGIFKGHVEQSNPGAASETDASITRVHNADTVYLRDKSGEERRVSISSVRQPKPKDPQQAPFSADAKEFLRKKLIGKHVKVTVDGRKAATEGFEEQDAVTIIANGKNVALQLVEAGYASAIRHGKDSKDRSPIWDEIFAAEAAAQAEKKGMWSSTSPAAKIYQDYSENLQKAKIQASVLQRQKKIPGVVDFVKGGSRFTILVPRENAKLTLVISGIRCPRSARNPNEKSEPFGQEAHDFANRRCLQRDIEFEVETTDKTGGFIGSLYVNRENFAKLLLEEGLASVHGYSAEQSGNSTELYAAEEKAKAAKKGMWHDYDPSQDAEIEELSISGPSAANGTNGTEEPHKKDYRDVIVTHIDPITAHLKLQLIGPTSSQALAKLMSSFAKFHASPPSSEKSLPGAPKAGDFVAARFSDDKEWYRAKIRRNDREAKKSDVLFIDYGNAETLPWSELRPLTQREFSTQTLKAQAVDAGMSFLQFPTSKEYLQDALDAMTELTANHKLVASVDAEEKDGGWWVTLFDAEKDAGEDDSVNAAVVRLGCAMVSRKLKAWERGRASILESLQKKEAAAMEEKAGMWEYGDISED